MRSFIRPTVIVHGCTGGSVSCWPLSWGSRPRRNGRSPTLSQAVGVEHPWVKLTRGSLALARRENRDGNRLLRQGVEPGRFTGDAYFFFGCELLGQALAEEGSFGEAVRVLEGASLERARTYPILGSSGYSWMRVRFRLAELYRKAGRLAEAQVIESELLRLLSRADRDHAMVITLRDSPLANSGGNLESARPH